MFTRYFSSVALGLLVATGLLWLMQFLIDIGPEVFIEDPPDIRLAWIHERKPPPVDDDRDPPDRLPPPVNPPPNHRPPGDGNDGYLVDPPTVGGPEPMGDWKVPGITMTDGPLVAMMAVRPVYPVRATSLGLEGHVIVQFDVDELGAVVTSRSSRPAIASSSNRRSMRRSARSSGRGSSTAHPLRRPASARCIASKWSNEEFRAGLRNQGTRPIGQIG
jgi:hypothetical protein